MATPDTDLPKLTPLERRSLEIDLDLPDLWSLLTERVCVDEDADDCEKPAIEYLDLALVAQALRVAYDRGERKAKAQIYDENRTDGYEEGYAEGLDGGYEAGYSEGLSDGGDDSLAESA